MYCAYDPYRELALILVRHAKDIKTPLNQTISTPSYVGDSQQDTAAETEKTTTLFRELIKQMPSEYVSAIWCVSVVCIYKCLVCVTNAIMMRACVGSTVFVAQLSWVQAS